MKSFDTELKKYSEKINLKISERRELRDRILSYMEYHPLPKQSERMHDARDAVSSESFITLHFNAKMLQGFTAVFILIMIVVPLMAERTVPGDILYLVKTGINEQVQSQLVKTPYEKIEFETRLMERRISEARVLASEGKLTEAVKIKITGDVKEHSDAVQSGLAKLRTTDADAADIAQIAYSSSLDVQSAVLAKNENEEIASSIKSILTVVNEAREEVSKKQGSTTPSFIGLRARVELETTRAYELFETVKKSATEVEKTDIERRLSDINRMITEAEDTKMSDEALGASDLAAVLKLTQKLILFMTNIDVRNTITLEALVPVVLSAQERIDVVHARLATIGELYTGVVRDLPRIEDKSVTQKVSEGIVIVDELVAKATTAISFSEIKVAETASNEAHMFITDLDSLVRTTLSVLEEGKATGTATSSAETNGGSQSDASNGNGTSTTTGSDVTGSGAPIPKTVRGEF